MLAGIVDEDRPDPRPPRDAAPSPERGLKPVGRPRGGEDRLDRAALGDGAEPVDPKLPAGPRAARGSAVRRPVLTNTVSPSVVVWEGTTARARPAWANAATRWRAGRPTATS